MSRRYQLVDLLPLSLAIWLLASLVGIWARRFAYPYDLEWMEGGMLTHAWRILEGLPLYPEPSPAWVPMIYPPGYSAAVATLGSVVGLDYPVGRAVSLGGTLLAAGVIVWVVWRQTRDWVSGSAAAVIFLGCYPTVGAFYDLVRPDGLAVGLLALTVAFTLERGRKWVVLGGLTLCLGFIVKHNVAAYGIPIALALAVRNWRDALAFIASSALPALLFTAAMQVSSGGHFLTYLLEVPASHPMYGNRAIAAGLEAGRVLPVGFLVCGLWGAVRTGSTLPIPLRGSLPLIGGLCGLFAGILLPVPKGIPVIPFYAGPAAFSGLGIATGALLLEGGQRALQARGDRVTWVAVGLTGLVLSGASFSFVSGLGVSGAMLAVVSVWVALLVVAGSAFIGSVWSEPDQWQRIYLLGTASVAFATSALMRGHHGGFTNVFIPLYFLLALGLGLGVASARATGLAGSQKRIGATVLGAGVLSLQLLGLPGIWDLERLVPSAEDRAAGDKIVETLSTYEGPVFSPYAPWLAYQAGHRPSFHLIALWDVAQHKQGPYHKVAGIPEAARTGYWKTVVDGPRGMGFGVSGRGGAYAVTHRFRSGPKVFRPKTGWPARPEAVLEKKQR